MDNPKLFISYSWSNPEHEQRVIALATELRESGVEIILDKWDLKEGHDAIAFMEKMVTDPEIKKVAMVCDRIYAEKADGRSGGVGTETQIISKEVYEKEQQDKFVAIVSEKDSTGKAYLPTYYKSRIYIDLSEPDNYAENFEKLLRWVFDKPLYIKPDLGKKPAFLSETETISLGTTSSLKRAIEAIKNNKPHASGALDEYLKIFSHNLERFRISNYNGEFDDAVIKNIEEFIPYRNEAIQLFVTIAQYFPEEEFIQKLHRFFESLVPYMNRPDKRWDFDNFRFIIHELFLFAIAILLRFERFTQASILLRQHYYLPSNSDYGRDVMISFHIFREFMDSLKYRNDRLKLHCPSLRADLLKERCQSTGIDFIDLMQADFVLFMRAELDSKRGDEYSRWWPETLLYVGHYQSGFEIFARAKSRQYFDKIKCLLDINAPNELSDLLADYNDGKRKLPLRDYDSFNPASLLGFDKLATKP